MEVAVVPVVEARNVSKLYGTCSTACRSGSAGGALVADNAAGKPKLVKIIAGAIEPDRGGLYLDGKLVALSESRADPRPDLHRLAERARASAAAGSPATLFPDGSGRSSGSFAVARWSGERPTPSPSYGT